MKLIIKGQQMVYENQPTADELIERINENVTEGYYFSHFVADGVEVFDEHEEYLEEHLADLEELIVVIKTEKEFMNDVLLSAEEYLQRANPEVRALVDEFNRVPTIDTWDKFDRLIGGMEWLSDMLKVICNSAERPTSWKMYHELASGMQAEVSKLGKAVEKRKNGQISAILKAGVLPIFEQLLEELGKTIDAEYVRKDFH